MMVKDKSAKLKVRMNQLPARLFITPGILDYVIRTQGNQQISNFSTLLF
jgi:hypothetical protein